MDEEISAEDIAILNELNAYFGKQQEIINKNKVEKIKRDRNSKLSLIEIKSMAQEKLELYKLEQYNN